MPVRQRSFIANLFTARTYIHARTADPIATHTEKPTAVSPVKTPTAISVSADTARNRNCPTMQRSRDTSSSGWE